MKQAIKQHKQTQTQTQTRKAKQVLSLLLIILMIALSVPLTAMHAFAYNTSNAVSYANDHWNDGVGLCAEFVARCLNAGGITIPNDATYYKASKQSYQNNSGTLGSYTNPYTCSAAQLLWFADQGYQIIENPSDSQFSLGDVAFMKNTNGSKDGHVGLITKVEDGHPYYSAHNYARNQARLYSCTYLVKMYGSPYNPISIQEGVYSIHSARDENMVVDIQYDSKESGANIQVYHFLDNNVQKFRIAKCGDYYTIQSMYSNNWLDIKTPIENRSNVQLYYSNTFNEEKWFFEDAGNGYVAIRNYYGYYLDIAGDSAVDNANIQVYNTLESNSQKWRLVPDAPSSSISIPEGVYTIHSAWSENKVLDIASNSKESRANIQLFDFTASNFDVQRFRVVKSGKYYTIQSVYSNNWLDIATPITHRSNIQLFCSNANNEEKWFFEDAGNGYVNIRNYYGYYVDIAGDSTENHANIQAFRTKYNNSQRWWLVPDNYTININANGGTASTSSFSAKYGNKCNLSTSFVQRTGYKLKGWNLYRPGDGKWFVGGVGWKTPAEISAGGYTKQVYVPNLSMTLDYSWIRNFSGLVSSISSFTFYAVWEECSHTWNSGTVTKAATCSATGVKTYTCTACNATKTETIAALGHNFGAWTKLNDTQHQRVCSRDSSHVEKANHTWNSGVVTKAATCSTTGVKTYTCSACGATKTETIAKNTNHTWNSGVVTKAATCSATGVKTYTCTACGATKTETIAKNTNHANTTNVAATVSTCTAKGYTAGVYCNDCKKYINGHQEQPLAAHRTETRNARTATCSAEGYTGDQYCTVCKQTISTGTTIAKKAHSLTTINKKDAGCTTAGYTGDQYCTVCKQTISKGSATNVLGHTSPDGNGNCTRCGTHIKDVTPSQPTQQTQPTQPQQQSGGCKYCGGTHSGPLGGLIQFFHNILAIFKR